MPGMSGADLQDALIADGNQTPVIFISASLDEQVRSRVLDAGAYGFLHKPFKEQSLIDCLHRALNGETAGAVTPVLGKRRFFAVRNGLFPAGGLKAPGALIPHQSTGHPTNSANKR